MARKHRGPSLRAMHWDEAKHPRDDRGRFAHKGGAKWMKSVLHQVSARMGDISMGAAPGHEPRGGRLQTGKGSLIDTRALSKAAPRIEARTPLGPVRPSAPSVSSLKPGDHARVSGIDQYGKPMTLNGHVGGVSPVRMGKRGSKRKEDMLAVSVSETPSGANGWRGTVYTKPDATAEHTTPRVETTAAGAPVAVTDVNKHELGRTPAGIAHQSAGGGAARRGRTPSGVLAGGPAAEHITHSQEVARAEAGVDTALDTSRVGRKPGGVTTATPSTSTMPSGITDPVERAQIREALATHGGGYYGGPLGMTQSDTARYTTEGHLKELAAKHGYAAVQQAVAEEINRNPGVLNIKPGTPEHKAMLEARQAESLAASKAALAALNNGKHDEALRIIDQAQLKHPSYRESGHGWGDMRAYVSKQRPARTPTGVLPAPERTNTGPAASNANGGNTDFAGSLRAEMTGGDALVRETAPRVGRAPGGVVQSANTEQARSTQGVVRNLSKTYTPEAAAAELDGLTGAELRDVARQMNIRRDNATKDVLKQRIVQRTMDMQRHAETMRGVADNLRQEANKLGHAISDMQEVRGQRGKHTTASEADLAVAGEIRKLYYHAPDVAGSTAARDAARADAEAEVNRRLGSFTLNGSTIRAKLAAAAGDKAQAEHHLTLARANLTEAKRLRDTISDPALRERVDTESVKPIQREIDEFQSRAATADRKMADARAEVDAEVRRGGDRLQARLAQERGTDVHNMLVAGGHGLHGDAEDEKNRRFFQQKVFSAATKRAMTGIDQTRLTDAQKRTFNEQAKPHSQLVVDTLAARERRELALSRIASLDTPENRARAEADPVFKAAWEGALRDERAGLAAAEADLTGLEPKFGPSIDALDRIVGDIRASQGLRAAKINRKSIETGYRKRLTERGIAAQEPFTPFTPATGRLTDAQFLESSRAIGRQANGPVAPPERVAVGAPGSGFTEPPRRLGRAEVIARRADFTKVDTSRVTRDTGGMTPTTLSDAEVNALSTDQLEQHLNTLGIPVVRREPGAMRSQLKAAMNARRRGLETPAANTKYGRLSDERIRQGLVMRGTTDTELVAEAKRRGIDVNAATANNAPAAPATGEASAALPGGNASLGVHTTSKGRETVLTLPDGSVARRTSKTKAYTHAVVATVDNHRLAQSHREAAQREQSYVEALQAWIDRGADISELKAYPTASLSYNDQKAGRSNKEYFLPGFGPTKEAAPRGRYGGGSGYWADHRQYGIPDPADKTVYNYKHGDNPENGKTKYEYYGPEYLLDLHRRGAKREAEAADRLAAGPQYSYNVRRWSQSAANAQAATQSAELGAGRPGVTLRVVGIEGATEGKAAEATPFGAMPSRLGGLTPADAAEAVKFLRSHQLTPAEADAYINSLKAKELRKIAGYMGMLAADRQPLDKVRERVLGLAVREAA